MENVGSNQSLVKHVNQELIVEEIRRHEQLSRSDLAKMLRLSNPSISKNVEDLKKKGLIIEGDSVKTQIGRRPRMLNFNGKCACVAAVDFSGTKAKICISDLDGNIIESGEVKIGEIIDETVVLAVCDRLEQLLDNVKDRCGNLNTICIGSPGNIDPDTGRIRYAFRIKDYKKLDLGAIFKKRFNVKTAIVKNDVNLAVSGEHVFGVGADVQNLLYVSVDRGVGAGIILLNKLYEGTQGFAGEIGLSLSDENEKLDEICSVDRIVLNVINHCKNGGGNCIFSDLDELESITVDDISMAIANNDQTCIRIVKDNARTLAKELHNINVLLDLDMIIIGGSVMKLGDTYIREVRSAFSDATVRVNWSLLGDKATISGAVGEATKIAIKDIINSDYQCAEA